jgi:hypothetical protein
MKKISHLDGWLYIGIAIAGQLEIEFATSDASTVMIPATLFWAKLLVGVLGTACGAGKAYRSTTFKSSQEQQGQPPTPAAPATDLPTNQPKT